MLNMIAPGDYNVKLLNILMQKKNARDTTGVFPNNKILFFCVLFRRCRSQVFDDTSLFAGQSTQEE